MANATRSPTAADELVELESGAQPFAEERRHLADDMLTLAESMVEHVRGCPTAAAEEVTSGRRLRPAPVPRLETVSA